MQKKIRLMKSRMSICLLVLAITCLFAGCAGQQSSTENKSASAALAAEITSVTVSSTDDLLDVVINGTGALAYTSVKQPIPMGVVLYFPNTQLSASGIGNVSPAPPVLSVHATQIASGQNATARIEILLAADIPYQVIKGDSGLRVQFAKSGTLPSAHPMVAVSRDAAPTAAETRISTPTGTFQGTGAPVGREKEQSKIWVNRIDFLGESDGRSVLAIETTSPAAYDIRKVSDTLLELRLSNVNIAEFRQRPLVTTRFESAVNRIMPIQLASMKDHSLFSIELREPVSYSADQTGNILQLHFDASSVPPVPMEEARSPSWKKMLSETLNKPDGMSPAGASTASAPPEDVVLEADQAMVLTKPTKNYTGEKIALDFYQTDLKNVFRILREVSGKNFAIDKDVTGKVTLAFDTPVPWDQVMDLVLRMNQLGMIVEGDIIRIATLTTLKQENDLRNAQMAALQKEKEQVKALEPLETRYIPISYSDAEKEILPHIQNIATKDRGVVSVDLKNNQIIITDTAEKIVQAQEIVRKIDKVTSQVIIEARVVEVSETFSKQLGASLAASFEDEGGKFIKSGAGVMNFPFRGDTETTNYGGFGFSLERLGGTPFSIHAELTALEQNGNARILSSPKIVTLNNKKARIKQGREYGYMERDSAGGSSVEFKDVDLLLEVTPHVTPDNRISLDIMITKNDVVELVNGVPVISTNEAETKLLVNDGDTIVIGGIIKNISTKTKEAFPSLYKIPIIGWLFQNDIEDEENSELLIFMNPKIVQLEQRTAMF